MNTPSEARLLQLEEERLRPVFAHDVLDAEPVLEFDALTRLASHAFSAPIALVTLDPTLLWFTSHIDLAQDSATRRLAFEFQPLTRATEPVVIEDLTLDRRFQFHPLVSEPPHLRFVAGSPIICPEGRPMGALAIIDTKPRVFSAQEMLALSDLTAMACSLLRAHFRAKELINLATTDPLTRLANRAGRDAALNSRFKDAQRRGDHFALAALDLEGFSRVVDRHGHVAGDQVLVECARRMSALVRGSELLARIAGDEFSVLLRHGNQASATSLVERLAEVVRRPITLLSGHRVNVQLNAGTAEYNPGMGSPALLLSLADRRLADSKQHANTGRGS